MVEGDRYTIDGKNTILTAYTLQPKGRENDIARRRER